MHMHAALMQQTAHRHYTADVKLLLGGLRFKTLGMAGSLLVVLAEPLLHKQACAMLL